MRMMTWRPWTTRSWIGIRLSCRLTQSLRRHRLLRCLLLRWWAAGGRRRLGLLWRRRSLRRHRRLNHSNQLQETTTCPKWTRRCNRRCYQRLTYHLKVHLTLLLLAAALQQQKRRYLHNQFSYHHLRLRNFQDIHILDIHLHPHYLAKAHLHQTQHQAKVQHPRTHYQAKAQHLQTQCLIQT